MIIESVFLDLSIYNVQAYLLHRMVTSSLCTQPDTDADGQRLLQSPMQD